MSRIAAGTRETNYLKTSVDVHAAAPLKQNFDEERWLGRSAQENSNYDTTQNAAAPTPRRAARRAHYLHDDKVARKLRAMKV